MSSLRPAEKKGQAPDTSHPGEYALDLAGSQLLLFYCGGVQLQGQGRSRTVRICLVRRNRRSQGAVLHANSRARSMSHALEARTKRRIRGSVNPREALRRVGSARSLGGGAPSLNCFGRTANEDRCVARIMQSLATPGSARENDFDRLGTHSALRCRRISVGSSSFAHAAHRSGRR
jgi:hypothetical protein